MSTSLLLTWGHCISNTHLSWVLPPSGRECLYQPTFNGLKNRIQSQGLLELGSEYVLEYVHRSKARAHAHLLALGGHLRPVLGL